MSVVFEVIYIPNHGNGQEQKECDSDELRIQRTASLTSPHQPPSLLIPEPRTIIDRGIPVR
jgi:hypothetical protein